VNFGDPFGLEPLSEEERQKLGNMCDKIDCDEVRVYRGNDGRMMNAIRAAVLKRSKGRSVTLGNMIFLSDANANDVPTLAHELFHAGEYQELQSTYGITVGGPLGASALYYGAGGKARVVEWTGGYPYSLPAVLETGPAFNSYGFEQRAQIVQLCFQGNIRGSCSISPFRP
jgi:hypothetical protein